MHQIAPSARNIRRLANWALCAVLWTAIDLPPAQASGDGSPTTIRLFEFKDLAIGPDFEIRFEIVARIA